ncbi:MAG: 2-hydroxyacid dehydrogenase [Ruminococcaceae bacterium]|nr:2-hydroxyacid dehydrogenase [Oscillospiraceae bacterium]
MKIAFFDTKTYDKPSFDKYAERAGITMKYFETKLTEDTASLAQGFDGVCVFVNDTVSALVIDILLEQGCKFIALRCAGFNNVDFKHLAGRMPVFNVPAYSPHSVAEHAMAMLLTSIRRIHKAYIRTRDFNFSLNGMTGFDLHSKTVGVVGTGKIGRCFIDICRGFGMKVLAYDKYPADIPDVTYVDKDTLFRESDIISLHCPLTDDTYHMIDDDAIAKMKKRAIIINTSRGALIDAAALLAAIKERRLGGACLDVYEDENDLFFEDYSNHIVSDDVLARLISMPNVIVTSHQAFLTEEALDNIAQTTIENVLCYLTEGCDKNRVIV